MIAYLARLQLKPGPTHFFMSLPQHRKANTSQKRPQCQVVSGARCVAHLPLELTTPSWGVQHPLSVVSLQEVQSGEMGKDKLGDGTYLHSIHVILSRNYTLSTSTTSRVTPISHYRVKLGDATTWCHCKTEMVMDMWEGFVTVQRTIL